MSTNDISRYLVKANGSSFASDNELQSLAVNSKVTNINSGLTYKKSALNVYDKTPIEVETDAVLYSPQTLTDAQKLQARQNIGAGREESVLYTPQILSDEEAETARDNISAAGISLVRDNLISDLKLTAAEDYHIIQGLSLNRSTLSSITLTNPRFLSNRLPKMTVLWSGDLHLGDITLSHAFTDYDALLFVYGTDDNSPGTPPWNFSVVPVWMLQKAIIDKDVFGVVPTTFDILNDHERRWEIVVADSTATFFKHQYDAGVHMWRVVGVNLDVKSPTSGWASSSNSSSSSSSSESSQTWGTTLFETVSNNINGSIVKTINQSVPEGTIVKLYSITQWGGAPGFAVPEETKRFYVWKANSYTLTNEDKTTINNLTSGYHSPYQVTYDSGNV